MFSAKNDQSRRSDVVVTMTDGTVVNASMRLPLSNKLVDALNNSDAFLDVITVAGQQLFIAKSAVRSVRPAILPKTDQLDLPQGAAAAVSDPYSVLQVEKAASPDEIRSAYHRLARLYHPDRIASYELPDEVKAYVRAMLVRINLAYEQIGN